MEKRIGPLQQSVTGPTFDKLWDITLRISEIASRDLEAQQRFIRNLLNFPKIE